MSNVENITKVYLLNVPLENDYKHTLHFTSRDTQYNYFESKIKHQFNDFTYQRKDNTIRVPMHFDSVYQCNYVMYKNQHYSNKWFYAFITDMEYINDECTKITIETDVIQTWYFDYVVKPSFVEREHVSDDTVGLHTVPELLETGEYKCNGSFTDQLLEKTTLVIGTTVNLHGENVKGGLYNGIYSALKYYSGTPTTINDFIHTLTVGNGDGFEGGKADAINCVFMAPEFLVSDVTLEVGHSETVKYFDVIREKTVSIDDYFPRNNKLLTFPYNYLLVSNNNGGSSIYKYEFFDGENCDFRVQGTITPGCSIRLYPMNYKGIGHNYEEGLNLGKYPICNWNTDVYTNWLTQNSVNIGLDIATAGIQIVGGVVGGIVSGGAGLAVGGASALSGVSQVANTLAQVYTQSFTPPQSKGNTNCGDVITSAKLNTFTYYQMSIRKEYAEIIDSYFDMFGYKVNIVKQPNKEHRTRYWFTKTIDVNIDGSIPNNDLQKIKDCYNNGITFWRNANEIQDYSLSNEIYKG